MSILIEIPKSNKKICAALEEMLRSDRLIHAFLFSGGTKNSREELGFWLAKKLLCKDELSFNKFIHGNHEDFILIEKQDDKESITKDQILELIKNISFKPFNDFYVIIIKDSNLLNEIAQNKLLKTLEEPTSQAIFILLSDREDALLQTIRSRCISYHLEDENHDYEDEIKKAALAFKSLILTPSYYYQKKNCILSILNDKDASRNKAIDFLECLSDVLEEDMLLGNPKAIRAIERAEKAKMYLKQSHNVAYTLKQYCLAV